MYTLCSRLAVLGLVCGLAGFVPGCKKDKDKQSPKPEPQRTVAPTIDAAAKPTPTPPVKLSGEQIVALIDGWAGVLQPLDAEKLAGFYSDNARYTAKNSPKSVTGNGAIAGWYRELLAGFPDMKVEVLLVLIRDQRAAVVYRSHGTNSAPMMGLAPKKKKVSFVSYDQLDFANKRIDQVSAYADSLSFLGQLGVYKGPHRKYAVAPRPDRIVAIAKTDPASADRQREHLALATRFKDHFNARDLAALASMYARDAKLHDPLLADDVAGRKPIRGALGAFRKAFPDATISDLEAWAAGDYVTATYRLTGSHTGRYDRLKLDKTGKRISLEVATVFRVDKGHIAEQWIFTDAATLAHQLGALKMKL